EVGGLAAAAAHEINNPLAVIMGYTQLLADRVDARGRGQIAEILKALSRIQEVVVRMKRVTRIELTEEAPYLREMLDLIRSSEPRLPPQDRKSTRLNSSHVAISYAVFCLKKKKN